MGPGDSRRGVLLFPCPLSSHVRVLAHSLTGNYKQPSQSEPAFPGPHSSWNPVSCCGCGWSRKQEATGIRVVCVVGGELGRVVGGELGRSSCKHIIPVTWSEQQRARATLSSTPQSQPQTKKQVIKDLSRWSIPQAKDDKGEGVTLTEAPCAQDLWPVCSCFI